MMLLHPVRLPVLQSARPTAQLPEPPPELTVAELFAPRFLQIPSEKYCWSWTVTVARPVGQPRFTHHPCPDAANPVDDMCT